MQRPPPPPPPPLVQTIMSLRDALPQRLARVCQRMPFFDYLSRLSEVTDDTATASPDGALVIAGRDKYAIARIALPGPSMHTLPVVRRLRNERALVQQYKLTQTRLAMRDNILDQVGDGDGGDEQFIDHLWPVDARDINVCVELFAPMIRWDDVAHVHAVLAHNLMLEQLSKRDAVRMLMLADTLELGRTFDIVGAHLRARHLIRRRPITPALNALVRSSIVHTSSQAIVGTQPSHVWLLDALVNTPPTVGSCLRSDCSRCCPPAHKSKIEWALRQPHAFSDDHLDRVSAALRTATGMIAALRTSGDVRVSSPPPLPFVVSRDRRRAFRKLIKSTARV